MGSYESKSTEQDFSGKRAFCFSTSDKSFESEPYFQMKNAISAITQRLNPDSGYRSTEIIIKADYLKDSRSFKLSAGKSFQELSDAFGIKFQAVKDLTEYLNEYRELYIPLIFAAVSSVEMFGNSSQVSVEMYHDPEIYDRYITVYIRQYSYDDDIMKRIDVICNKYEKYIADTDGWMMITTDFKPPAD